jgi:uncharacterized protein YraI
VKHASRYAASGGSVLALVFLAGQAFAASGYSTAHLNLRSGPGTQYPVVGVMEVNIRSQITGCLADWKWCSVDVAGLSGWASAEYLVVDEGGQIMEVGVAGAKTGIPIVKAEGVAEIPAGPVGGVVAGVESYVEAIVPEPAVLQYIDAASVAPVSVDGELVVGAVLPMGVQLYEIPNSPYGFAIINHVRVLVDLNRRAVVYIQR